MRFLMIVKATEDSEAGIHGKPEQYAAMGELMEDMAKAGHLILADGLKPSSEGKRLKIAGGKSWPGTRSPTSRPGTCA